MGFSDKFRVKNQIGFLLQSIFLQISCCFRGESFSEKECLEKQAKMSLFYFLTVV